MAEPTNPMDAAIAHLEAQRAEIDSLIQAMKRFRDSGGLVQVSANQVLPAGASVDIETIPSDAFFKMTIADAAVKFLTIWANRKPQSTNTIIDALELGGFDRKAYQTVYGILNRRAKVDKDVVNVKGDWGLAEWYGGGGGKSRRRTATKGVSLKPSDAEKGDDAESQDVEEVAPASTTGAEAQL